MSNKSLAKIAMLESKLSVMQQALLKLYYVTCVNGINPNDIQPPIPRNHGMQDAIKAKELAEKALSI